MLLCKTNKTISRAVCVVLICGLILSGAGIPTYAVSDPADSALAPPLATKPPCEIHYDEKTGTCSVVTDGSLIETWDRETTRSVRQGETLGKSFRNRWLFADISFLVGQMLILAREHKLQNPKDILIPLIKKHIANRNGMAEMLLDDNIFGKYDIDGIQELREGGEITGFSLPVTRNGTSAYQLIYNLREGDASIPMSNGTTVYVKAKTIATTAPTKDEIATRLSQLQKIRDRKPAELTEEDKQYLVEVAKYFNLYPEYLAKETDKRRIRGYAIALSILTSAELTSIDQSQTSSFALSAVDEIGTAFFSHELGHVVDDIAPLDWLFHKPLKDAEIQKDVTRFIDRFSEYAQVTGAWQKMLDEWEGLKTLNPNLILSLIDSLAQHLENIIKLRAELKKYLKEHSDKIGQEIVDEYSRGVKRAEGECAFNLIRLRELRQEILQSRVSTLVNINASIKSAFKPYRTDERLRTQLRLNKALPKCYGNPTRISYIWTNLLRNSIDAIDEATKVDKTRQGRIIIRTHLTQRDDKEYVEVMFSDNGNGIPEEMLRDGRLFQRGVTTKKRGTGLGLYLIYQTVKELGGTIDVQSEIGKGTTFTIRLPILSANKEVAETTERASSEQRTWVTGLLNLEQCKEVYLKFMDRRESVNRWRLWASLSALSSNEQETFTEWAGTIKDDVVKDGKSFARHNIRIGEVAKYMPASELWESIISLVNDFSPYRNDKEEELWRNVLMYANNNKLYAHGTANFFVRDGVDLASVSHHLQHHWALLNIMIEGSVSEGDAGALDTDFNNRFHATYYGPFYVIFSRFADDKSLFIFPWRSKTHAIYLVPREEAVVFLEKGLEEAVRLGLTTEENANEALSKVMTYKQFADNHGRIKDIITGKIKPADIVKREPIRISASGFLSEGREKVLSAVDKLRDSDFMVRGISTKQIAEHLRVGDNGLPALQKDLQWLVEHSYLSSFVTSVQLDTTGQAEMEKIYSSPEDTDYLNEEQALYKKYGGERFLLSMAQIESRTLSSDRARAIVSDKSKLQHFAVALTWFFGDSLNPTLYASLATLFSVQDDVPDNEVKAIAKDLNEKLHSIRRDNELHHKVVDAWMNKEVDKLDLETVRQYVMAMDVRMKEILGLIEKLKGRKVNETTNPQINRSLALYRNQLEVAHTHFAFVYDVCNKLAYAIAQESMAEKRLSMSDVISPETERIYATNFQDTLTYIQAQPQSQSLVVALGTSWIKGYEKGRYLQYDALNPLVGSLRTYCESKGIPFIVDDDDKLLARINAERAKDGRSGAKVVVLAGENTVRSDEFAPLRNDEKNAVVVGVNNQELTTDSYIRLMEMLTLALKLSAGLEVSFDNVHITITKDNERHIYIFLPHAEPMNYERLKVIYEVQRFA